MDRCNYPECDGGAVTGYCHTDCKSQIMIPTDNTLREFQRLMTEASEVAYSHDEYCQLVFSAAVKLASGEWAAPKAEKNIFDSASACAAEGQAPKRIA